jgi:hypothetical protein
MTARGSQKGGGQRNRPVVQKSNSDGTTTTITMAEAREKYGFRSEEICCHAFKADTCYLEDGIQKRYQHLPLGEKRLWRWVAMGDHGYNQVDPSAFMLFVTYSWDVLELILSGELAIVK